MQVLILTQAAAKTLGELWGVTLEPGIYEYRGEKRGFVQTSKLWDRERMLAMKPKGRQHTWGLRLGYMVSALFVACVAGSTGRTSPARGRPN